MLKYFTPVERFSKPKNVDTTNDSQPPTDVPTEPCSSKKIFKKGAYLEADRAIRSQILEYHPNDQDEVRRAYLVKGPCRPKMTEYPISIIGGRERCFQYSWHEEFDWLEYSKERDVVFCLPCYVCYKGTSNLAFVEDGFRGWNLKHKLHKHIGDLPNSYHKKCVKACEDLMKVNRSIEYSYAKHSTKEEVDYQELNVARAGDTRWGSHFRTLSRLVDLFSPIIEVLEDLRSDRGAMGDPKSLLLIMQTFDFVFMLHLMVEILSLTNNLSQALQKGDQDIVQAMELVQVTKKRLQEMRDGGWEAFYEQVVTSCGNFEIDMPDMESPYVKGNKSKRLARIVTTFHYFKNDCFLHVIDLVLQELNDRFSPENIELLSCVACLSPCYSFEAFDTKSLVRLARLYPNDFEDLSDKELSSELETYIVSVKMDDNFSNLSSISDLGRTLVRTKKYKTFRFVYTLVKLALTLPVATASVERVFAGMKYIKNELRSRMANPWLNDCLVTFVEKEVFSTIDDMDIIKCFQGMSKRRMHLHLD